MQKICKTRWKNPDFRRVLWYDIIPFKRELIVAQGIFKVNGIVVKDLCYTVLYDFISPVD